LSHQGWSIVFDGFTMPTLKAYCGFMGLRQSGTKLSLVTEAAKEMDLRCGRDRNKALSYFRAMVHQKSQPFEMQMVTHKLGVALVSRTPLTQPHADALFNLATGPDEVRQNEAPAIPADKPGKVRPGLTKTRKSGEATTLIECVDEVIAALSRSKALREYFSSDIGELEDRRRQWSTIRSRVGLLGITSSGKSTLLNAMLGARLLPAGVPPSSNTLVVCRRGDRLEAKLHFKSGEFGVVDSDIATQLKRAIDERYTPYAELQVKEVELVSPGFLLDHNTTLVDTPGLDAFGLDHHESLTMKLFLPTVDMVVFATTAKANSDAQIRERLDRIAADGKPVLMVQTMIDSIEPKLGIGGEEKRDKNQVAQDHRRRLQRLVAESDQRGGSAPPVFQVSARWALQGHSADSGIPQFVDGIRNQLEMLRPTIERGRHLQLRDILKQLLDGQRDLSAPEQEATALTAESKRLADIGPKLDRIISDVRQSTTNHVQKARADGQQFRNRASKLAKKDVAGARGLQSALQAWQISVPGAFEKALDKARVAMDPLAKQLNMRSEDYLIPDDRPRHARRGVQVQVHTSTWTEKKKRTGTWNAVKRFLGVKSGYDYITHEEKRVNLALLRDHVHSATKYEEDWVEDAAVAIITSIALAERAIRERLVIREKALKEKSTKAIAAKERAQVIARIGEIFAELEATISASSEAIEYRTAGHSLNQGASATISVPRYARHLIEIGHRIHTKGFERARDEVLKRGRLPPRKVLIWSWDTDSLERFVARFWSDVVPAEDFHIGRPLDSRAQGSIEEITLVDESIPIGNGKLGMTGTTPSNADAVFVMLDIVQSGATRSALQRSDLFDAISSEAGVIPVVQSVQALVNEGDLYEGLREAIAMTEMLRGDCLGMLVNDPHLSYTLLADRLYDLYRNGGSLRTHTDEMAWAADMKGLLPTRSEVGETIVGVLKQWVDDARDC